MRRSVLLLLAAPVWLACASPAAKTADSASATPAPAAADPAVVRKTIDETNAKIIAAMNTGDPAGWAVAYADNAISMSPNMPAVSGKAAITEALNGMFKEVAFSNASATTSDVIVSGDLAVESGTFTATTTPKAKGAKPITDTAKYVTVWQKQGDGSWKIVRDIFNSNLPVK